MFLRHLLLAPFQGSGYHGQLCLELGLGGITQASVLQVSQLVDAALIENRIKEPCIVFDDRAANDNDPEEVVEFTQICRSKGYTLIGITEGSVFPRWFPLCHYTVVVVRNEPWINFAVNEIWYQPAQDDPLVEPIIMSANAAAVKAIVAPWKATTELLLFCAQARFGWRMISPDVRDNVWLFGGSNDHH